MKIEFKIFEHEKTQYHDILGNIKLSDNESSFHEDNAYLASWLCVLAEGILLLRRKTNSIIDLAEEPDPIGIEFLDGRIRLTYKERSVFSKGLDSFEVETTQAIKSFLNSIGVNEISLREPCIKFLNDFRNHKIQSEDSFVQPILKQWRYLTEKREE